MQIAIADDDLVCRRMLEAKLSDWGFDVLSAADGCSAYDLLAPAGSPQLAILDWQMPNLDGVEVCRRIRERRPLNELFILMLTSRATRRDLAYALEAGANDYVTKPFDAMELKARLQVGRKLVACNTNGTDDVAITDDSNRFGFPQGRGPQDFTESAILQQSLQSGYLIPIFDPQTMQHTVGFSTSVLRAWEEDGTLKRVLLDRVQKCPDCRALPTFRFGCSSCGSGQVTNDRLIHHFACAYAGPVSEFEETEELVCPKCRARNLVVGADFEYLNGPYSCLACDWTSTELEHIGHCLKCGFRFPASQAFVEELVGYHVNRMDVLAANA
jgi:CheY-like chemotaxis protein